MMVSGNNKHSACQSGYFEPKFSRILEAEVGFYIWSPSDVVRFITKWQ